MKIETFHQAKKPHRCFSTYIARLILLAYKYLQNLQKKRQIKCKQYCNEQKRKQEQKKKRKIWVCSERSAQPGVVQGERWCQQLLIHTSQCSAFQRLVSIWGLPFRDLTFQLSQAWSCHPVILQIALTCTLTFEKVAGLEDLRGPLWCESRGPELWCILSGEAVQGKPQS